MGCTRSKALTTSDAIVDKYAKELFLVAGSGDVSRLTSLLRDLSKHKVSVGVRKELINGGYTEADGLTALSIAAGKKHKELTEVLAEMPEVDVNRSSTSGITALLMVAEVGWADVLRTLLDRGADVNASPTGRRAENAKIAGSTPLIGATKYNHPDCVALLLKNGARADHQNASGISALMLAAEQGYTDCVRLLVEIGRADLELAPSGEAALAMNLSGQTPLFCAAKEGHLDIVQYLLSKGANPNAVNHYGVSVLWIPSQRGFEGVVRFLLDHKANPEAAPFGKEADERNIAGWTPLYVAMKSRRFPVARILLEHGADPNAITKLGSTPFLLASEVADIEMIKFFVDKGAALDFAPAGPEADRLNITGQTPLFMATLKERVNVVGYLIKRGANVNIQNRYGVSPLLLAAENGNLDLVRMLVQAGAEVDITPSGHLAEQHLLAGQTPLFGAAKKGFVEVCSFLVENGANINMQTITGVTPLYTAVEEGKLETVKCLLSYNANVDIYPNGRFAKELKIEGQTPLLVACMKNFEQIIVSLLKDGRQSADPNISNERGSTPFLAICQHNNLSMAKLLIEHGANYRVETTNLYGGKINCLIVAAESGSFDVLRLLVEKGLDPNYEIEGSGETSGRTPLFCACAKGYIEIVRFLVERGADVNSTERSGLSCVHIATTMGHLEIVQFLADKGADVNQVFSIDGQQANALELAIAQDRHDISEVLRKHGAKSLGRNRENGAVNSANHEDDDVLGEGNAPFYPTTTTTQPTAKPTTIPQKGSESPEAAAVRTSH